MFEEMHAVFVGVFLFLGFDQFTTDRVFFLKFGVHEPGSG